MSAKKSFDVSRKSSVRKADPAPTRRKKAAPRASSASRRNPVRKGPGTLAHRRREAQSRMFWVWVAVVVVVAGAVLYGFWRPEVRIATVEAENDSYGAVAEEVLSGSYYNVFPRDSIFFYPEKSIRAAILDKHPDISALSVSRTGFTSISIETISRSAAFWWCGTPENASAVNSSCYEADAEGFIFRPVNAVEGATSTPSGSTLRIYGNLVDGTSTPAYPLRARMESLEAIPDVLRFVKAMKTLNVSPVSVAIRGDEADLFIPSSGRGTRITYVLGREEEAAALAAAVFPSLNLTDGSVEYVDLRFSGKAYIKRRE